jgi:hypothetical protein
VATNSVRTISFAPDVIRCLADGPMTQTQLTEAVWGTSGRNNPNLVNLLRHMTDRGEITMTKRGNAKVYRLPDSVYEC